MKRTLLSLLAALALPPGASLAQTNARPAVVLIRAGRLIDTRAGRVLENQGILVEGDRVKAAGPFADVQGRAAAGAPIRLTMRDLEAEAFGLALRRGVKIAFGTDARGFAWTENEAREFGYTVRYGMTPTQAIRPATVEGARLLDQADNMGAIEPGKYADIIATAGDPLADVSGLERVRFVMKGGAVVRDELSRQ